MVLELLGWGPRTYPSKYLICDNSNGSTTFFCLILSTAKTEEIRTRVLQLLNRHCVVFGDYSWTEFDDVFLTKNVNSVAIVDTELKVKDRQVRHVDYICINVF